MICGKEDRTVFWRQPPFRPTDGTGNGIIMDFQTDVVQDCFMRTGVAVVESLDLPGGWFHNRIVVNDFILTCAIYSSHTITRPGHTI